MPYSVLQLCRRLGVPSTFVLCFVLTVACPALLSAQTLSSEQTQPQADPWDAIPKCEETTVEIDAARYADIGEKLKITARLQGPGTFAGSSLWRLTDHGGGVEVAAETLDVEHAYDRSGGHMIRLRVLVQGPDGQPCQALARSTVRVKLVPGANFDVQASCDEAVAGQPFTCRADFPGDATRTVCDWTFVPGQPAERGQEVQYIFDTPGDYTVHLEAKQLNGGCAPMGVCVKMLSVKIPVRPADPEP